RDRRAVRRLLRTSFPRPTQLAARKARAVARGCRPQAPPEVMAARFDAPDADAFGDPPWREGGALQELARAGDAFADDPLVGSLPGCRAKLPLQRTGAHRSTRRE